MTIMHQHSHSSMSIEERYKIIRKLFEEYQQEHVFKFWETLNNEEKESFLKQLEVANPKLMKDIFEKSYKNVTTSTSEEVVTPPEATDVDSVHNFTSEQNAEYYRQGLELISQGKVGVLLLAGGQGTRLGSDKPKGLFVIDQVLSHKTLFQIQAERIYKLQELAKQHFPQNKNTCIINWYIMTSEFTDKDTEEYFKEKKYFGLGAQHVIFFNQESFPCLSLDGKFILENKSTLSFAPNGNGAVYQALEYHGVLKHMETHGVEHIHSYCVDNVLVRVADPVFVGFCAQKKADIASKVIPKRDPHERVGVFGKKNGAYHVVEYSEITKEMAERIDPQTKQLAFNHSNIANFYYSKKFLQECANIVKTYPIYHVAKKKIPHADEQGNKVESKVENGIKMELFNFDICQFAKNVALLQVDREFEFSPLKNAMGADSPQSCLADLTRVNTHFLTKAGATVVPAKTPAENILEISPLLSYAGEGLEAYAGKTITLPAQIPEHH